MKFNIDRDEDTGSFFFYITNDKGKVLLRSYYYGQKIGAKFGIRSIRENGSDPERYHVGRKSSKSYTFSYIAKNNIRVADAEKNYRSKKDAEADIKYLTGITEETEIIDHSKGK